MSKIAKAKKPKQITNIDTDGITREMAIAKGIEPGTYNERQVYALIESTVYRWGDNTLEDVQLFDQRLLELQMYMLHIDHAAAIWRGKDLLEKFSEADAGKIMGLLTELVIIADRLHWSIGDPLSTAVMSRADGIKTLINDHDDGAALRSLAENEGMTVAIEMSQWRDSLKIGRPKKSTEKPLDWLCRRLVEIFFSEKMTQREAYEKLVEEVRANQTQQPAEWAKLDEWERSGSDGSSLWANVRNRPELKAALENRKLT